MPANGSALGLRLIGTIASGRYYRLLGFNRNRRFPGQGQRVTRHHRARCGWCDRLVVHKADTFQERPREQRCGVPRCRRGVLFSEGVAIPLSAMRECKTISALRHLAPHELKTESLGVLAFIQPAGDPTSPRVLRQILRSPSRSHPARHLPDPTAAVLSPNTRPRVRQDYRLVPKDGTQACESALPTSGRP